VRGASWHQFKNSSGADNHKNLKSAPVLQKRSHKKGKKIWRTKQAQPQFLPKKRQHAWD
jgi:hypothetical protein